MRHATLGVIENIHIVILEVDSQNIGSDSAILPWKHSFPRIVAQVS